MYRLYFNLFIISWIHSQDLQITIVGEMNMNAPVLGPIKMTFDQTVAPGFLKVEEKIEAGRFYARWLINGETGEIMIDGTEKMSKTVNNYVGITEPPGEMFGKLMSISDVLMWDYYKLLTDLSITEIDAMRVRVASGDLHPKQMKVNLASRIVADFHSAEEARAAADGFERQFSRKELPDEVEEWSGPVRPDGQRLTALMVATGMSKSGSAATRVIIQGGVKVDGARIEDRFYTLPSDQPPFVLQVGKRALRILLRPD